MCPSYDTDFIDLGLPADPKYFNVVSACIAEVLARVTGISEREMNTYSVQLAVQEICTNMVDHAYASSRGRISITLKVVEEPLRVLVDVRDEADRSFDPTTLNEPSGEELEERGRGLLLIRQLVDEALYCPAGNPFQFRSSNGGEWTRETKPTATSPGSNEWHLVKNL